ncbi:MAG: TIGR03619 family F420-dependent LLM class oxidoreductase [Actinobacteria bacterium]|nr:TIGR03619 family F420-dependent LLM class oxidoreductase [Actinomycetota bacterium]
MRLGLNLVGVRPDRMPALAARAEELGYESVFVPDHVVIPVEFSSEYPGTDDGAFPYGAAVPLFDPWTVLATIGVATTRIRLGTAVYLLGLRHPILTARHAVTLEALVGPRLVLGVGVGWLTEEFAALGVDPRTRFSRTEEAAVALRSLWTEPGAGFHGRHFDVPPVHLVPSPASQPHPPILFGGDSDGALRRALRFGDGWMSGGVAGDVAGVARLVDRLAAVRVTLLADGDEAFDPARAFGITVLHPAPAAADVARMAELGVERVVVMPWVTSRDAPEAIERFMAEVADRVDVEPADRPAADRQS